MRAALADRLNPHSKANGSLMRASPLGIYAHALDARSAAELAHQDSRITHPNPACLDAVAVFVIAIAHALRTGDGPQAVFDAALRWADDAGTFRVREALRRAQSEPPVCDAETQGYVMIAFQNAFYELLHATSLEEGVVATVRRGGDTDTNAAIAGRPPGRGPRTRGRAPAVAAHDPELSSPAALRAAAASPRVLAGRRVRAGRALAAGGSGGPGLTRRRDQERSLPSSSATARPATKAS